jgi:hypothetical protein
LKPRNVLVCLLAYILPRRSENTRLEAARVEVDAEKVDSCVWHGAQVTIVRAESDVYAAEIDESVVMKIGAGVYAPDDSKWVQAEAGHCWTVWYRR